VTKFEDVKNQTTEEYFEGNQFSVDAFNKKYRLDDNETYVKALKRVCDAIASVEKTEELRTYWSERWFDEIYNDWWHPAGSIMQGAGSGRKISLCNCTCASLGVVDEAKDWDNLESIIKTASYSIAKIAAYRQGLGLDFSKLRPRGTKVLNSCNESTGAIHWMQFIDSIGYYVGQKGRIPAMLFSLSCDHPDIEEFITVKSDYGKIQNANISVQCKNSFYEAAKANADWELIYKVPAVTKGQKVYIDKCAIDFATQKDKHGYYVIATHSRQEEIIRKVVNAKDLLMLIATNMFNNAEPGIQNIDIARKYSNSDYVYDENDEYNSKIEATNAPVIGKSLVPTKKGLLPIKSLFDDVQADILYDSFAESSLEYLDGNYTKNRPVGRISSNASFITSSFKKYYNQRVWEIDLQSGPLLECNSEHKWFTQDGMKKTSDIVCGDKIFCGNNGLIDLIGEPDKKSKDFRIGEFLGWFTGDGFYSTVYKSKGIKLDRKAVGFLFKKDEYRYYEIFQDIYKELTGKEYNYVRNRGNDLFETRTQNKHIYNFLNNYGFNENKYHIPEQCYSNINLCAGYLSGLFSADGGIYLNSGKITLTSVSKDIVNGVQQLLLNLFGIQSYINEQESKPVPYTLADGTEKFSNHKTANRLNITKNGFVKKFFNLIGFGVEHKNITTIDYIDKHKNSKDTSKYNYYVVKNITKTDRHEDMYCAVVPEKHSLIINGLISSNCSEQYLSRESLCVLSSINCGKFSVEQDKYEQELETIGRSVNRFLDNVNEYELVNQTYATPIQKIAIQKLRRTGAGYTNITAWLFKQNLEYASLEANQKMEKFTERYNYWLYKNSVEVGVEKGNFGLFNKEKLCKSPFIQRMMTLGLEFDTLRNITCSSIAPTGSLSLMFRGCVMSYGIENGFGLYYWKRTRISGKYEYYFCVPRVVREYFESQGYPIPIKSDTIKDTWDGKHGKVIANFIETNKHNLGIKFKSNTTDSPFEKLDLMSRVMKWIDSSISVTYMFPENTDIQVVYDFIVQAYEKEVKSIAAFPDRKMYGIVSNLPFKELAVKLFEEGVQIHKQNFSDDELAQLNLRKAEEHTIVKTNAPKRPKSLPADFHHVKVGGKDHFVVVGLYNDEPYEVIAGLNGFFTRSLKSGELKKVKRGSYKFVSEDEQIEDINNYADPNIDALTRMISTSLRHGADISFIVHQLEKTCGDMQSFSKAIARVLKKYVKDGTKVSGASCHQCKSENIVRHEGCATCIDCGYSKCS